MDKKAYKIIRDAGADQTFEQVVMGEVLIPDIPNSYGDVMSRDSIKEFVYAYALKGYDIDADHDFVDITGTGAVVVESFIARKNDPDGFIEGSWVVAMKILDDALWARVLAGDINGYSYAAEVWFQEIIIQNLRNRQIVGTTEPNPIDGHTHDYVVLTNALNQVIEGGTTDDFGHSHRILTHTVTENAIDLDVGEHRHRYQVIVADEEQPTGETP